MKKIGFLVLILMTFFLVSCGKDVAYYKTKFQDFDKEKLKHEYVSADNVKHDNILKAVQVFLSKMHGSRPSSAAMTTLVTQYEKLLGDMSTYSGDFDSLSREYGTWKNALLGKISDLEKKKDSKEGLSEDEEDTLNKLKAENAQVPGVDQIHNEIKSNLDNYSSQLKATNVKEIIFEWLSNNTYVIRMLDLVASFCLIGGSVWIVLGTISLAGSLKDKNGPTLQTSIWQIVGGSMIMVATGLFRNVGKYPSLLNDVLKIAAKFSSIGGALWTVWGVLILAGALKDKVGPALQSAIWQIVGGIMIIVASSFFLKIVNYS